MKTPWAQAQATKRAQKQERGLAALPGGHAQINSGRTPMSHRDVRLNGYLIEARFTDKDTYSVSRREFDQITRNAIGTPPGLLPAIQLDFQGGREHLRLWVCRFDDAQHMEKRIALLEEEIRELNARLSQVQE